ncbi:MAG: efflux RND transporter periplasmic adaptor subunit [Pseudomonadota bacterium]
MSIPTPYLIAFGLTAGIAGWMLTGDAKIVEGGRADARPATIAERNEQAGEKLFKVRAELFRAEPRQARIDVRGSTEASQNIAVRTETMGLLNARHVKKGQSVKAGDLICTLNVGAREAEIQQMQAQLAKAELDYQAALALVQDGFATRTRVNENKADVDAAKAELKAAQIELERTQIVAPISGIVQDPFAKVGDMLQIGDVCANVMKPETMTMVAQVSERHVGALSLNQPSDVKLVTGEQVVGNVKYIAPSADIETRTFRVEIALPNEDGSILNGITATASIDLPGDMAHKVPSSVLTLDDLGRLGVRTLDAESKVQFQQVTIVDDTPSGLWITGLPETVKIITLGQEYVVDGQTVDAVVKTAEAQQ